MDQPRGAGDGEKEKAEAGGSHVEDVDQTVQ